MSPRVAPPPDEPRATPVRLPARPRRHACRGALLLLAPVPVPVASAPGTTATHRPERRFLDAAVAMKRLALARGDQPYGAVLVIDGQVAGAGPSRVVERGDPDAHAEREAIRDAQRRLGRDDLRGSVLYSTSRPCGACEAAAARARVGRMIHGDALTDAGAPRG